MYYRLDVWLWATIAYNEIIGVFAADVADFSLFVRRVEAVAGWYDGWDVCMDLISKANMVFVVSVFFQARERQLMVIVFGTRFLWMVTVWNCRQIRRNGARLRGASLSYILLQGMIRCCLSLRRVNVCLQILSFLG